MYQMPRGYDEYSTLMPHPSTSAPANILYQSENDTSYGTVTKINSPAKETKPEVNDLIGL